ncbi:hypothetical protein CIB48_g9742 [Xylaria polymorpha]|nr:hypothetical protein CIB48_g9742 [Xylaria polymorpha]
MASHFHTHKSLPTVPYWYLDATAHLGAGLDWLRVKRLTLVPTASEPRGQLPTITTHAVGDICAGKSAISSMRGTGDDALLRIGLPLPEPHSGVTEWWAKEEGTRLYRVVIPPAAGSLSTRTQLATPTLSDPTVKKLSRPSAVNTLTARQRVSRHENKRQRHKNAVKPRADNAQAAFWAAYHVGELTDSRTGPFLGSRRI